MSDRRIFASFWRLFFLVALAFALPPDAAPHVRPGDPGAPRPAAWTVDPPRSHATIAPRWTPFVPYRRTRSVQRCASIRGRTARPAPRHAGERAPSPITSNAAADPARQGYFAAIAALQGWALRIAQAHADPQDDAADIAQAALLAALENFEVFAPDPSDPPLAAVRRWVAGILEKKRLMARRFRLTRGEVPLGSAFAIDAEALRHPGHEGQVEARSVLGALRDATTPERWGAWYSFEAEGMTAAEIAARDRILESRVNWLVRQARQDFARVLAPQGGAS